MPGIPPCYSKSEISKYDDSHAYIDKTRHLAGKYIEHIYGKVLSPRKNV